jgi:hypothetical protein
MPYGPQMRESDELQNLPSNKKISYVIIFSLFQIKVPKYTLIRDAKKRVIDISTCNAG